VGFAASLAAQVGIPSKTGISTDSDWLNYDYDGTSAMTNYLHLDNITERAILLRGQVGWQFPVSGWLSLEPFAAFGYMDFKWTARDGYFQYPPHWFDTGATKPYPPSSTDVKANEAGVGIIYQQTWLFPAMGITATFKPGNDFALSASFSFSPFVFCDDVDNHQIGVPHDFYDYLRGGFLIEPKVSAKWRVSGTTLLSLDVSFLHIEGVQGESYKVNTGIGYDPNQVPSQSSGASAGFDALDASVSITWTL